MRRSRRQLTAASFLALGWAIALAVHVAAQSPAAPQSPASQAPAPRSPDAERARWDRMFETQPAHIRWEPNRFLAEVEAALMPGTAIDVGMGSGRNAIFLAERGWNVTGVDTSAVGLAKAMASAKAKGTWIDARQADQFAFDYGHEAYDLIVWMYMGPPGGLGTRFVEALKPGGHLVIEHFAGGFAPGSLPEIFKGLEVVRYDEVEDFPDYDLRTKGTVVRFLARKPGLVLPDRLLPVDEAGACEGFPAFREQLRGIVRRKDARALMRIVAPDVRLSFGGESGRSTFRRTWLAKTAEADIWAELEAVLALGGTCHDGGQFVAPYVTSAWPQEVDALDRLAVIGARVPLKSEPRGEATTLTSLDHALVHLMDGDTFRQPWWKVRAPGGHIGYVERRHLRSPIDMRAYFTRDGGRWMLTTWIGGD